MHYQFAYAQAVFCALNQMRVRVQLDPIPVRAAPAAATVIMLVRVDGINGR